MTREQVTDTCTYVHAYRVKGHVFTNITSTARLQEPLPNQQHLEQASVAGQCN